MTIVPDTGTCGASRPRVVVISPCRNEEATLARTIESMRRQTHSPVLWVVVDDGSTDGSPAILARASREIPWLRVERRRDRGYRKVGRGVVEAFYAGLAAVEVDYDYVVKMDVDLEFSPRYFARILEWFGANRDLAAISGKVYLKDESGHLEEEYIIDEQVSGAFKFYRREAFERIGGFVHEVMWDGIDFHRARLAGYKTASVRDPDLRIFHLRRMGSSDRNVLRGRLRWGRGQWFMGTAFPYILASGLFRATEKPYVLGGLMIVLGYLVAGLRRMPRYDDPDFRRGLRDWQYRRLRRLLTFRAPAKELELVEPSTAPIRPYGDAPTSGAATPGGID